MPGARKHTARPAAPSTPAGRPRLPREFVAGHKRSRIMRAIAELTAEKGYEGTKIADVVRRAGVARKTLYENFEGKEELFLAAFDVAVDEAIRRMEDDCAKVEGGWEARVRVGLASLLGYVAEEPALAHMCMIEALSATPAATERHEEAVRRFVALAEAALPQEEGLPETIEETLVGGVSWILYRQLRSGRADQVEGLLPELSEFVLGPYRRPADVATG